MKELKSKNQNLKSMQNKNESKFKKRDKGDDKSFKKFRFKFPTKKQVKKDAPLSNETTNIVISVSGLEGDYACVAIDKDHLPSENDNSFNVKPKSKKKKTVSNDNTSKMYASESGLVLEENVIENFDLKESIDYDNPQKAEEKKKERILGVEVDGARVRDISETRWNREVKGFVEQKDLSLQES